MDAVTEVLKHYAVEFIAALIIVGLTLARNILARIITFFFVKVTVHGRWETQLDRKGGRGLERHEDATLRQFIHAVWGHTKALSGEIYHVKGTITGDRLCLVYKQAGAGTDTGAALLTVMVSGDEMVGYEIGMDKATSKLYSFEYKWARK